jgi:hypothetical protein
LATKLLTQSFSLYFYTLNYFGMRTYNMRKPLFTKLTFGLSKNKALTGSNVSVVTPTIKTFQPGNV